MKIIFEKIKTIIDLVLADFDLTDLKFDAKKIIIGDYNPRLDFNELKYRTIQNCRGLINRNQRFDRISAKILLYFLYVEVFDWDPNQESFFSLWDRCDESFEEFIKEAVSLGLLSNNMLLFDFELLVDEFSPDYDDNLTFMGLSILIDRYFLKKRNKKGEYKILETPQYFWLRVSMGLNLKEEALKTYRTKKLFNIYRKKLFCSSTPTLFNSGTKKSQLSSCFLYKVDDSLKSIMNKGISENAFLSKWSGGVAGSWTSVRGLGSYIKGTNGESQGVIPFLKLHNAQLLAVNQGGKRKGSGCVYLELWHNDILDFLKLRKNTGDDRMRTHDMNTAVWIPDLFMRKMENREKWRLFRSNDVEDLVSKFGSDFDERYHFYDSIAKENEIWSEEIDALFLWKEILKMLFETGHPWITFKDACNLRNPQSHCGTIHSSNLCTEITLNTSEEETAVCNLGSIVLTNHFNEKGELNKKLLIDTIKIAVRTLDNIIDLNFHPTKSAEVSNFRNRAIGIGIMGLQDVAFLKNISFESQEFLDFNNEIMEFISFHTINSSIDLAIERGKYPSFKGSTWSECLFPFETLEKLNEYRNINPIHVKTSLNWKELRYKLKKNGIRNSNLMAIAPTATISNIVGVSPSIEPIYSNAFVKSNLSGDFININFYLVEDLQKLGLWNKEIYSKIKENDGNLDSINEIPVNLKNKYKTAFDIDSKWIIEAAAARQKWIDQSQSINLWLKEPSLKTMSRMYRKAWKDGLKTTYYLRTKSASKIEKSSSYKKICVEDACEVCT